MLFVQYLDGQLFEVNAAFQALTGFSAEELEGRTTPDVGLLTRDSRNRLYEILREEGRVAPQEVVFQTRWGPVPTLTSGLVVESEEGPQVLWVISDISQLKASEEKFRAIFQQGVELKGVLDLDGTVLDVNQAALAMVGARRDEVVGKAFWETLWWSHTAGLQKELKDWIRAAAQGKVSYFESRHPDSEGGWREVEGSIAPVRDPTGTPRYLFAVAHDVTERKSLQGQLHQAQKLDTLGTLASGIAHDFNNLLVPILGYADLVQAGTPPEDPLRLEMESHLMDAARQARELVRQILTFSRGSPTAKKVVSLQEPVEHALRLARATVPTSIRIRTEGCRSTARVLADPSQLEQVVLNLATNAAHAMRRKGGILDVSLEEVSKEGGPEPGDSRFVALTVRDTGEGMSQEVLQRIFDPFFTTKAEGEGTGLGLSVLYGIVRSHGGQVEVESRLGEGSTFRIFLPLAPAGMQEGEEERVGEVEGKERILVVDDREGSRMVLRQLLERLGYRVTLAESGPSALARFLEDPEPFDLAILDYDMPGMTGVHLALELLQIREDLPVILTTGTDPSRLVDAEALGIRALVMKPFTARDLGTVVRGVLDTE